MTMYQLNNNIILLLICCQRVRTSCLSKGLYLRLWL